MKDTETWTAGGGCDGKQGLWSVWAFTFIVGVLRTGYVVPCQSQAIEKKPCKRMLTGCERRHGIRGSGGPICLTCCAC